jgi:hypothetical protein
MAAWSLRQAAGVFFLAIIAFYMWGQLTVYFLLVR